MKKNYRKYPALASLAILTLVIFSFVPILYGPGIENAHPMAAYLNGVFPGIPPSGDTSEEVSYGTVNAFPNLTFIDPVDMLELPGTNEFLIVGLQGHIWKFDNDPNTTSKELVLDISESVISDRDGGMLGIVLHPEYGIQGSPNSEYLYVFYRYTPIPDMDQTGANVKGYMRLSRFNLPFGANAINPSSEQVLINIYDRHDWHNGGDMFFGPNDGFLYIVVGDEGGANDNFGVSQQINKWLFGGVLRIDVDKRGGAISHPIRKQPLNKATPPDGWPNSFTQDYYIPNDNPWVDSSGSILEEFYAIGTRSPHRMTIDPPTGEIWIGDIGQGAREEISIVRKGDNLQWPYREGNVTGPKEKPNPLIGNDRPPIHDYGRGSGTSVIGGFVYRGNRHPELKGKYLFGDQGTQNVWALTKTGENSGDVEFLFKVPVQGSGTKDGISSFFGDSNDHIYILDLFGTAMDGGVIRKVIRSGGVQDPPSSLSELNVFADLENLTPIEGIIPYDVNAPLWSDRALKKRWIALPNDGVHDTPNEQIVFDKEENWSFPSGTVLIKHFDLPTDENDPSKTTKLETRFIIFTEDNGVYGVTYKWNDEQTDAFLIGIDETVSKEYEVIKSDGSVVSQTWDFPTREQCTQCHNSVAGYALGLKTRQINKNYTYPSTDITSNQLETWNHLNMFSEEIEPHTKLPALANINSSFASDEMKVRSYIDGNCAYCHRPNGVEGAFDGRSLTALYDQSIINEAVASHASLPGYTIIQPQDAVNSMLYIRDSSTGEDKMPPVGRNLPDEDYLQVLIGWIDGLDQNEPMSITEGWYTFEAGHSNKFLTVENASTSSGAKVVQATVNSGKNSKWFVKHMENKKYRIIAGHSDMVLSVGDLRTDRGANVIQEPWNGSQQQLWYFKDTGQEYLRITNAYNGLELNVHEGSLVDNQQTTLWSPGNFANQRWKLESTSLSLCPESNGINLSDLTWTSQEQGFGKIRKNTNLYGGAMQINGQTFDHGIATHAQSEIVYDLSSMDYENFSSFIGVDDTAADSSWASVQFEVVGDGYSLYRSETMGATDDAKWIEVNIKGVHELKLLVHELPDESPATDFDANDHADWAAATLNNCPNAPAEGEYEVIGETGKIKVKHIWVTVDLNNTYTDPVVITGAPSYVGNDQTTVRVQNVTKNSFQVRIDEWECLNERHLLEEISYLVVEAGIHELPNGKLLQAGNTDDVNEDWHTMQFDRPFGEEPIVLGQCVTENEAEAVTLRFDEKNTSTSQMRFKLKEHDMAIGGHAPERVSWLAVEPGIFKDNNGHPQFEHGNTGREFRHKWKTINFSQQYSNDLVFIGQIGSEYGSDAATLRHRELTNQNVEVFVEEEECYDQEIWHVREEIHYMVYNTSGDIIGKTLQGTQAPSTPLMAKIPETGFYFTNITTKEESHLIDLNWTTSNDTGIESYVVERSVNGHGYFFVSEQPGMRSKGKVNYNTYDSNPVIGRSVYRITGIKANGEKIHSHSVEANFEVFDTTILLYPNPVYRSHTQTLTADIRINNGGMEDLTFSIYSVDGKLIRSQTKRMETKQAFEQFKVSDLQSGVYILKTEGDNWSQSQRFVVQ